MMNQRLPQKGVTEVDSASSSATRKSKRGTAKEVAEEPEKTSDRKGKKGSETLKDKTSEDGDSPSITRTVQIKVPKMDISSDSDVPSEAEKPAGARRGGKGKVAASKVDHQKEEENTLGKGKRSSRRGQQSDDTEKDVPDGDESKHATRGKRGKKGKLEDSKLEEEEDSEIELSKGKSKMGKKKGTKAEAEDKPQKSSETPSHTSRRKKGVEEISTEDPALLKKNTRTSRRAAKTVVDDDEIYKRKRIGQEEL